MDNKVYNIESNINNYDIVKTDEGAYYANDSKQRLIYTDDGVISGKKLSYCKPNNSFISFPE